MPSTPQKGYNFQNAVLYMKKAPAACLARHKKVMIFKNNVFVVIKQNASGMPRTPQKGYTLINCVQILIVISRLCAAPAHSK